MEEIMLQDIAPQKLCNQYDASIHPKDEDIVFCFYGKEVLLAQGGLPTKKILFQTFGEELQAYGEFIFLFKIDEMSFFLCLHQIPRVSALTESDQQLGFSYYSLRGDLGVVLAEDTLVFAAFTAYHLYEWYDANRFCGHCGAKMQHDDKERALRCSDCDSLVFPRINPAVIVAVRNGEQLLMTKYVKSRGVPFYALIAGFTEIGETAEETVKREVMEEVGLAVKNIRYYKSQPWGFDSNLLLGYFCELAEEEEIHLDEEELSVAEWVDYHDVPEDREKLSLTHEMMTYFKEQRRR